MNRYDKCVCGDTYGKHDDNGVCRVKTCDCLEFQSAHDLQNWGAEKVHTSYGGE